MEKIIYSASPPGLVCSVLLKNTSIATMMDYGVDENPLMLKTLKFAKNVSILLGQYFEFKNIISLLPYGM